MSIEWETPPDFFYTLNMEFSFTLDVCANEQNKKCDKFFSLEEDGLKQDWGNNIVWCNPPYDRSIGLWMKKAYESAQKGALVVTLIQGRSTNTIWWHDYVMKASEIRFIKNRLNFGMNGKYTRANIASTVVIFFPWYCEGYPKISSINVSGQELFA